MLRYKNWTTIERKKQPMSKEKRYMNVWLLRGKI